jgi:hypothetical protein
MEKQETRLLEEWKANNDLFKFHEELKQKRFTHFMTIQTAFIAIISILAKYTFDNINKTNSLILLALALISLLPMVLAFYFLSMDARARAYVDTVKGKLLLIEDEWRQHFPGNHFATYEEQFAILVHRNPDTIEKYITIRGIKKDPYYELIETKAANISEKKILWLFVPQSPKDLR